VRSHSVYAAVTYNFGRSLTPNTWHHVAATFQASTRTLTLYLDGVQVAQDVLDRVSTGNTLPVDLGRAGTSGKAFAGKLDDVRLWNVVRSPADIAANYKAQLSGPTSGLVANWTFDDGTGSTAVDSTTPPENAALAGGASFSTDVHP
jgi:hypothetical protein